MNSSYHIAVLPGDGIGMEVMKAADEVLQAAAKRAGLQLKLEYLPAGAQHYVDHGVALPDETLRVCESADAMLFGAMGLPHVRFPDGTEIIPQLDLRFHFDLYAGLRPIRTFKGLSTPLASPRAAEIDLMLVRENTEGLFYARGRGELRQENGVEIEALDTMKITRHGTERICRCAFDLATHRAARKNRPGRVTSVDKANVFTSMAFWRKIFEETASRYPAIGADSAYVDAMALNLVMKPWDFDVLVTENMFGDILSDLVAALVGGMGMAPSGDIGDKHGLFQPAHGTAPDIAGQGKANPTAMILSASMMLEWLAQTQKNTALADAATAIDRAVEHVFAEQLVKPMEFGGTSNTRAITDAVVAAVLAA